MNKLAKAMRTPRCGKCGYSTVSAWWYINAGSIDVLAQDISGGTTWVSLKRSQLERAIEVMDEAKK